MYGLIIVAGVFTSAEQCEAAKPDLIVGAEITRMECVVLADASPRAAPRPTPKPQQEHSHGQAD